MSGVLTHSPSQIIQQLFVDLGIGTLPETDSAWPIAATQEIDGDTAPDDVITIFDTTARRDGRIMNDGVVVEHYGVQAKVRSRTFDDNQAKLSEIQNAMDSEVRNTTVTIGTSEYIVSAISRTSIIRVGQEPSSKRSISTINATVSMAQTS